MMRKNTGRLAAMGALAFASGALAQDRAAPQAAQAGRAIEGRLSGAEVRHSLRLNGGETVRITARSRAFDTFLKLYAAAGTEPLAEDDDSGGGTVAELTFSAPRAGVYQIAVSESGTAAEARSDRERAYDLTVLAAPTPVVAPVRAITPNADQPTRVNMAQCGAGCRFSFQARQGDRLIAETSADDSEADPILELRMGSEKLAQDDDSGEGVNARITRPIPTTGTYTLVARTLSGGGNFALAVSTRQHVARAAVPVVLGTPVSGTITAGAEMSDEGRFYDAYTLHGRAGQRLVIDMESSDLDSEVRVLGETVLGPVLIASNDDADAQAASSSRPQSLNSHLVLTFVREGDVEVRATSLNNEGAYRLRVSEQAAR